MNKSRNGSYVLGGLVALQVCSLPALVDSDRMLRFATHALLGYVAFAVVLLLFAGRSARPVGFRSGGQLDCGLGSGWWPEWPTRDLTALAIGLGAAFMLFGLKWGIIRTLAICAAAGLALGTLAA